MWDNAFPSRSAAARLSELTQNAGDGVTSATPQIIFPYMSDAHVPAMGIRMALQDTAMAQSFRQNLRCILIEDDG